MLIPQWMRRTMTAWPTPRWTRERIELYITTPPPGITEHHLDQAVTWYTRNHEGDFPPAINDITRLATSLRDHDRQTERRATRDRENQRRDARTAPPWHAWFWAGVYHHWAGTEPADAAITPYLVIAEDHDITPDSCRVGWTPGPDRHITCDWDNRRINVDQALTDAENEWVGQGKPTPPQPLATLASTRRL